MTKFFRCEFVELLGIFLDGYGLANGLARSMYSYVSYRNLRN